MLMVLRVAMCCCLTCLQGRESTETSICLWPHGAVYSVKTHSFAPTSPVYSWQGSTSHVQENKIDVEQVSSMFIPPDNRINDRFFICEFIQFKNTLLIPKRYFV
ncbi:hypothetical protein AMECASPLE_025699 [Ameca splendens]|uniref:Secreted protein n=1 Tax=Ameca splendens TaxID=208324 RepID=A0ABV0YFT9_9TELE